MHFTPASGWINDPNGLIFYAGEYHLFYQHHPAATVWGPMHWGHAVSRDLVHWEELPIALAPDDIGAIFSGSAVLDRNNTAGFGADAMVAIFTHDTNKPDQKQAQSLAYSLDRGRTWTKYSGNPVLLPPVGQKNFRDPKVFWSDNGQQAHWVMALAVATEIWFYRSANLKEWTMCSRFGADFGSHSGVWECPELIQLALEGTDERHWVLIVSVGNGAPAGGSGVQYFVGQFDGATFTPHEAPSQTRWADYGADFYAPQAWNDAPDGRKLWLAWMNNWSYGNQIPDSGGWRGAMTMMRELSLRRDGQALVLIQRPVRELAGFHGQHQHWTMRQIDKAEIPIDLPLSSAQAETAPCQSIHVVFRVAASTTAQRFGLLLRGPSGESVEIGYNIALSRLSVNRRTAGSGLSGFANPHHAALSPRDDKIALQILIDRTSIEIFADDGQLVMTEQVFLNPMVKSLALFAEDGFVEVESLDCFQLGLH